MDQEHPRQLFVYGTLCAIPLLAWVLTGDAANVATVRALCRPAKVHGYTRRSLHHKDFPAVIRAEDTDHSAEVDGFVITFQNASQRRKLDDFEGELYKPVPVSAEVEIRPGQVQLFNVDMYLWDWDMESVSTEPWSLEAFIEERLEDWLDLFAGMELIGED